MALGAVIEEPARVTRHRLSLGKPQYGQVTRDSNIRSMVSALWFAGETGRGLPSQGRHPEEIGVQQVETRHDQGQAACALEDAPVRSHAT